MSEVSEQELGAIDERIAAFRARLDAACVQAGREPSEVALIAVTKNHPPEYALQALRSGLLELGENRPQDLIAKRDGVEQLDPGLAARARWHFIGRLQRNKAKQVVAAADMVHSIDRVAVAEAVAKAATGSDRWSAATPLPVLLQVNLDPAAPREEHDSTASRGGVHPLEMSQLAARVAEHDELRVAGLMAIAPLDHDPGECFARLAELSMQLRLDHPAADIISAGMTGDFPAAVANGATHVRVGTALFGERQLA
ncbi:YggS family pyridoxal phosphate-dependent enzyme [Blastococcus sp. Marseille-P5729]|uniref:YggS family pyridoxal phosphate-dependent enzyme n=1 Tax=Blastococcus sp. Marseille-P5729 TaxID=2086582 RepID=UPI000D0ECBC6|nr:YggS family pyridoxal phosphate-dependent enzyme [Blastococcus sp. Marseille-P5729]